MSDRENDVTEEAIDPPDNQGGGKADVSMDSTGEEAKAIDPPDNQ
ncbi:MAG: hypothetical protein ABR555_07650 [Pyrinomonadaceae bacterium]